MTFAKNFNRNKQGHIKGTQQTRKYYIGAEIRAAKRRAEYLKVNPNKQVEIINELGRLNRLVNMFDNIEFEAGQLTREQVKTRNDAKLFILALHNKLRSMRNQSKQVQLFKRNDKILNVLVLCEESQTTTIELRKLGHNAYSNDLQDCSGGFPEYHIKGDSIKVAKAMIKELAKKGEKLDLIIAHPPCTYLANSGVQHLHKDETRWSKLAAACTFFRSIQALPVEHIAIENPIPHKYAVNDGAIRGSLNASNFYWDGIGKYDQLIQPYYFGHKESKATCFWLTGLPKLEHTSDLKAETMSLPYKERNKLHWLGKSKERAKLRSKTFSGIARAMASQWTEYILNKS